MLLCVCRRCASEYAQFKHDIWTEVSLQYLDELSYFLFLFVILITNPAVSSATEMCSYYDIVVRNEIDMI